MNYNNIIEWLPAIPFVTFVTFWIFWDTFHFVDENWMKYRYYIIQKIYTCIHICLYVYTWSRRTLSLLIYVQHVQWMSNTGCFQHSSLFGNSSCAMLLDVAWSWLKGQRYQHISHRTVILLTFRVCRTHPQVTKWLSTLPTIPTGDLFQKNVSWCDSSRWYLPWGHSPNPSILTHQCHYSSAHIQSCCHPHKSFLEWFLSSDPLNGMCLFSPFSGNLDVNLHAEE